MFIYSDWAKQKSIRRVRKWTAKFSKFNKRMKQIAPYSIRPYLIILYKIKISYLMPIEAYSAFFAQVILIMISSTTNSVAIKACTAHSHILNQKWIICQQNRRKLCNCNTN